MHKILPCNAAYICAKKEHISMVEVKVYDSIANKGEAALMEVFGVDAQVFSADSVRSVFQKNAGEKDFRFNIHCDGGSVPEGLAIYDIIRTSGKNIYAHVDGACHSMAVIVLLAAPPQHRTANPNARALLHRVRYNAGDSMTAAELEAAAKLCSSEESAILKIYAERTGGSESEMRKLIHAEKERTAQELLSLGFISKITGYNTNSKVSPKTSPKTAKKMGQTTTTSKNPLAALAQQATGLLGKIANALTPTAVNYDYTDEEGNVLFSTESEEDTLAVGDKVTIPDGSAEGTFTLPDGRTVTVADGAVTAIDEAGTENERISALETENESLRALLNESKALIEGYQAHGGSNYTPNVRTVVASAKKRVNPTKEELKNDALEKRKLAYAKKN
jgi:ATP-dependent Clp protease protease subunit